SKLLTRPAGPFLSFRDQHEVPCRLDIQPGTLVVADHHSFFAATHAQALIRSARQYPLYARKIRRQFLAARMLAGSVRRAPHQRGLTFLLHHHFTDDGLEFEQFHLRVGELFAARSILLDAHQPQLLFQHPNPQLRVLQPALQLCDEFQIYQSRSKRSSNQATHAAACPSGRGFRYHRLCLVLARSIPPNKRDSSSWLRTTLPCASPDCGQVKRPFSNRLAQTQSPLPSQTRTFKRLRWPLQNKNRCPLRGSHDNRSRTKPYSPSNPLRMSLTPAAR